MTDASLFDRLKETLRHPWATQAFTFASVVFLIAAWQIHGQGDVYNRLWLSRLFAGIGVGYLLLRAWAGGLHRWLARKSRIGVRRARRVEIDVSGADVATVAVVLLVVLSGVSAIIALDSGVQNASAAGTVQDDFESGNFDSDWTLNGVGGPKEVQSTTVYEGSYAAKFGGDGSTDSIYPNMDLSVTNPDSFSTYFRQSSGRDAYSDISLRNDSTNNQGPHLKIESNGDVYERDGGANGVLVGNIDTGTWYRIEFANIDYTNEQYDVNIYFKNGSVKASATDLSFDDAGTEANQFYMYQSQSTFSNYFDFMETGGAVPTYSVSGTVSDGGGSAISGATVSDGNGNSTTTDSNGNWNLSGYPDGTYSFTASKSGYHSKTTEVTVDGGDATLNFSLSKKEDTYTHTFVLDDNTERFQDDPELAVDALDADSPTISDEDWSHVATKSFNFEHEASVDVDEDTLHRLTVRDGSATYQEIGFRPIDEPNPYNLTIGTETATPTPTPTGNESEFCTLTETSDGGLDVTCAFPDPVSSYDYSLAGPNGSLYNGSLEFDEPTDYYQGEFSENFTESNLTTGTTSLDDLDVTWDGTYANGTSFNGTTSLFGGSDGGGGFSFGGPTGKSGGGGGGLQQAGGIALLAGAAILGYRRISDQSLTQAATSAASTASNAAGRVASAASGVVGRLRGGGRG